VPPQRLKFQSMATTSRPLSPKAKVGAMSRIQMSSTGASITVTFGQQPNSRRASRKDGPRGPSTRTGSYRAIVWMTSLSSRYTLLITLPHSGSTAHAIQQQTSGSHSTGRIVIYFSFQKMFCIPEIVACTQNQPK
jgi:hypothetical protein